MWYYLDMKKVEEVCKTQDWIKPVIPIAAKNKYIKIEKFVYEMDKMYKAADLLITRAGGVISSHCGPGTLGVLFIEEE